jgi:hypothetical protein
MATRGRKPIEVDAVKFQTLLTELESGQVFANRTELWKAVEMTDFAKNCVPRPLTAQVAMLKAEEMKLTVNTPKGKRGRMKGEKPPVTERKKKVFSLPMLTAGVPKEEQAGLVGTLQKAANGSLKARIKLNCLNCTNYDKTEIRECEIRTCPMWDVRPYRQKPKMELTSIPVAITPGA